MKTFNNLVKEYLAGDYKPPVVSYGGKDMNPFTYELIVTKYQLGLYAKGITPYRGWSVSNVKKFYEIKGSGQRLLDNFIYKYGEFI